jgi:CheY-like chemotaxis protein
MMNFPTKPHVAILEDHDDTRELLRVSLQDDFTVSDFREAVELLRALETGTFAAIVADIMLPGLDGYNFVRTVRSDARLKDVPVIAVTALAMANDREKALTAGFTEYLAKPVEPQAIIETVRRCLDAGHPRGNSPAA